MGRLIREIIKDVCISKNIEPMRIQLGAIDAIRTSAEGFLISFFEDANIAAIHAGRVTVMPRDMQMVLRLVERKMVPDVDRYRVRQVSSDNH